MSEETKKGIFSKLFGNKKSGCCNVKIEEIKDEQNEETKKDQQQSSEENDKKSGGSCCCG